MDLGYSLMPRVLMSIMFAALLPCAAVISTGTARAAEYPAHPVKIIVQTPAGTAPDVICRLLAEQFARLWRQQVVVVNQPGGGGTIASRTAVTAAPDGYSLFMPAASIFVSMPELYRDLSFDVSRDLTPIGFVGEQPLALAVRPALGVNSLQDLIAMSRQQPAKINLATIMPVGSLPNLAGELLRARSRAQIASIPYPGTAEAVNDLLSGRVQMIIESLPGLAGLVSDSRLKILTFTSPKRLPNFPDVPTIAELLPDFAAVGWFVLAAPAKTDTANISKLSRDLKTVLTKPEFQQRLLELATYTRLMSPGETSEFIRSEQQIWKPVLQQIIAKAR
jgi:tripartite-type tricarboxylate transporter receptor subunit TctC